MSFCIRFFCLLLTLLLAACGGSSSSDGVDPVGPPDKDPGVYSLASNSELFEDALKAALKSNEATSGGIQFSEAGPEALASDSGGGSGFTQTYTLEDNVDEADLIKYTRDYLAVARNPVYGYSCCPACDCFSPATNGQTGSALHVFTTDSSAATTTAIANVEIGEITVPDREADVPTTATAEITGLYTHTDEVLTVLGSTSPGPVYGDVWFSPSYWLNKSSFVRLYDFSAPDNPSVSWTASFNGSLIGSRRIGNTLYVVSRFTPYIENLNYYYSSDPTVNEAQNQLVEDAELENLIPQMVISSGGADTQQNLFDPTNCYVPTDGTTEGSNGNGAITTITAIPLNSPDQLASTCYTGSAHGLYMSEQALYLVEQDYGYEPDDIDQSVLHKFSLSGSSVNYRGSGRVDGVLGGRGAMDFRLSEFNNDLRVVTSIYQYDEANPSDNVDHQLSILRESTTQFALDELSVLPNEQRPQEIGKPDETLYGVRFSGERVYLVTFERIDPLYVLDLADPTDPMISGELEVPGFSDFIHAVSDDLIVTLGKDVEPANGDFVWFGGMKVELFNVSDIRNPQSISSISIGDRGTDSEALFDRHAFTYAEVSNDTHRFAIPVDLYQEDPAEPTPAGFRAAWQGSGLHLFEIDLIETPNASQLVQVGEMTTELPTDENQYPSYDRSRRSVFHDESVFFINQQGVWSATWMDPATVMGPINPE